MTDIIFVNPGNRLSQFGGVSSYATIAQPLGVAMLAAYVRERGFSVRIIDAEVLDLNPSQCVDEILKDPPRFVGLTAFTTKMTAAERIIALLKERAPEIRVIIGGHHSSAIPQKTLEDTKVDHVVKGEGYEPMLKILRGTDEKIIVASPQKDIDHLPLPAWDLLPMEKYRAHHWQTWGVGAPNSYALIYTSLGCPFHCSFCSVDVVYGKRIYRQKSPDRVLEEFDLLHTRYKTKHIEIIDDTFTINKRHVEAICDRLIERGYDFNMWAFSRTDTTEIGLMRKMKKAGINWVFMGIEAGNDAVLNSILKKQNLAQIKRAIDIAHEGGMHVGTNYIFGLPNDTLDTMQETLELALELNTEWANFFLAMPYPGTEMYDTAAPEDLPGKWEQYGFFAPNAKPLRNKNLTSEQILRFRDRAFMEFYSSARYQKLAEEKFGMGEYVRNMLKKKIGRDYEKKA